MQTGGREENVFITLQRHTDSPRTDVANIDIFGVGGRKQKKKQKKNVSNDSFHVDMNRLRTERKEETKKKKNPEWNINRNKKDKKMHIYTIYEFLAMRLVPDTLVAKPHAENEPNNICSAVVLWGTRGEMYVIK